MASRESLEVESALDPRVCLAHGDDPPTHTGLRRARCDREVLPLYMNLNLPGRTAIFAVEFVTCPYCLGILV